MVLEYVFLFCFFKKLVFEIRDGDGEGEGVGVGGVVFKVFNFYMVWFFWVVNLNFNFWINLFIIENK